LLTKISQLNLERLNVVISLDYRLMRASQPALELLLSRVLQSAVPGRRHYALRELRISSQMTIYRAQVHARLSRDILDRCRNSASLKL
jgi:GAF domain-containing protein